MHTSVRSSHRQEPHVGRAKEVILASVHRGLMLESASRRLQDPISSQRASAEAQNLLSDARKLCDETVGADFQDDRVRFAIESLARALERG